MYTTLCILFELSFKTVTSFLGIDSATISISCSRIFVKIKNMIVTRHKVPIMLEWGIMDYKVQGLTSEAVTLGPHCQNTNPKANSLHKIQYCSELLLNTTSRSCLGNIILSNCKEGRMFTLEDQQRRLQARFCLEATRFPIPSSFPAVASGLAVQRSCI